MDTLFKELEKLEKLTSTHPSPSSPKSKSLSLSDSLDNLIASLKAIRAAVESGTAAHDIWPQVSQEVESRKKDIDDRQKEIYSCMTRIGKALDKKFPTPLPSFEPLFSSAESMKALERTILTHLLRTGQFTTAENFLTESSIEMSPKSKAQFIELHRIMQALRDHDIDPVLEWTSAQKDFLDSRGSSLEFHLHRSRYLRLILTSTALVANQYANTHLTPYYGKYQNEFLALATCVAYLTNITHSPYAYLFSPSIQSDLETEFAMEYCVSIGMSRQVPLRVVGDIGGGGALIRIEKGRKVMRDTGKGWSQTDELPVCFAYFALDWLELIRYYDCLTPD